VQRDSELGKTSALKTIFLSEYLRLEPLRREIHEGLNVIENWNSANSSILYGKGGEFASNKLEDQEILMLSLHLLQVSLVYINTLMIQQVLEEEQWKGRLNDIDLRALSPLKGDTSRNVDRSPIESAPVVNNCVQCHLFAEVV
jgi:TnpA family transposase